MVEELPNTTSSQTKSGISIVWRLLILISLLIAMAAGIGVWQIHKDTMLQQLTLQKLGAQAEVLDKQLVHQQLSSQNLLASLEQLRSITNRDTISPILVEVDYLSRLAFYNAQYRGDVKMVLALLEAAERRVSSVSSAQLADVRGALVSSITALKGVKAVDIEGVVLRLNALAAMVSDLPLTPQATLVPAVPTNSQASSALHEPKTWKEKLMSSLSEIKQVVVIQHLTDPVKPLMSPEQHINLVENIQLKLAVAQWAVLHRESAIYTAALAQVKDWVTHYFSDSEMTRAVIAGLAELEKVDIKPALPDFSSTLAVIEQAMEKHQQSIAASSAVSATPELAPPSSVAPSNSGDAAQTSPPKITPAPAGPPASETPPKDKPQNSTEPKVISS